MLQFSRSFEGFVQISSILKQSIVGISSCCSIFGLSYWVKSSRYRQPNTFLGPNVAIPSICSGLLQRHFQYRSYRLACHWQPIQTLNIFLQKLETIQHFRNYSLFQTNQNRLKFEQNKFTFRLIAIKLNKPRSNYLFTCKTIK